MIIKRFEGENFRNIEKCSIEFSPGINLLLGNNAQGKTNLAEGIYLFSRGKSFRGADDGELLKFGAEGFRLFIEYEDKKGKNTLEYAKFGKERRRKVNGYKTDKLTEFIGNLKIVIFTPDDLTLVKGGPEQRRSFLNIAISQYDKTYINIYYSYKKALENRNALLKLMQKGFFVDEREFNSWSEALVEYSSFIYLKRKEYIKKLEVYTKEELKRISSELEDISLEYKSDIDEFLENKEDIKRKYYTLLCENKERECSAGVTLFGPHRDEIEIEINGMKARSFASQGQQRSIVLSMKLAEGEIIKKIIGEYPVYIFDDVLSELDEGRQKFILSEINDRQIIITSCALRENIDFGENIIEVKSGVYENVSSHR